MIKVFEKICITPIDEEVQLMAQSAKIINEFKKRGFITRGGFVGVVSDKLNGQMSIDMHNRLIAYWACRVRDRGLNNQLLEILQTLKDE